MAYDSSGGLWSYAQIIKEQGKLRKKVNSILSLSYGIPNGMPRYTPVISCGKPFNASKKKQRRYAEAMRRREIYMEDQKNKESELESTQVL